MSKRVGNVALRLMKVDGGYVYSVVFRGAGKRLNLVRPTKIISTKEDCRTQIMSDLQMVADTRLRFPTEVKR